MRLCCLVQLQCFLASFSNESAAEKPGSKWHHLKHPVGILQRCSGGQRCSPEEVSHIYLLGSFNGFCCRLAFSAKHRSDRYVFAGRFMTFYLVWVFFNCVFFSFFNEYIMKVEPQILNRVSNGGGV